MYTIFNLSPKTMMAFVIIILNDTILSSPILRHYFMYKPSANLSPNIHPNIIDFPLTMKSMKILTNYYF